MRLLKRQKGLPFLLALGVLFILSASFLAVQLWSDKYTMRGAVQALEAPVMPPAMPKIVAPPPVKKVARIQPAKPDLQPAEIKVKTEADAAVEPAPADINAAEVKIVSETPVEKAPVKELVVTPVVEKSEPEVAAVQKNDKKEEKKLDVEKKSDSVAKAENKAEKQPKAVKKSRKAKKVVEPVPTEIPAEWNWFSQPLKLNFDDGKAVIEKSESGKSISLSAEEKVVIEPAPADEVLVSDEKKQSADEIVAAAEPSIEKPFMLALAKMARIRQMRRQNVVVSEAATNEVKSGEISPSLKAMGSKLRELCEKLDSRPDTATDMLSAKDEVESPAVEGQVAPVGQDGMGTAVVGDNKSEAIADEPLKPYYSGSGSGFSARINSMLKQGLIRAE